MFIFLIFYQFIHVKFCMYQGFCNGLRPFSPPLNCKKYYLKKFKMSEYIIIIITIIIIK